MTRTILFTDIEGSTTLWEQHPAEMERALAEHDRVVAQVIETNSGTRVKGTGDGVIAAFDDADTAVRSALGIQHATREAVFEPIGPLRVRIGIHRGPVVDRDGDLFGPTMNRAARIMSAAHGGQTICSATVRELLTEGAWDVDDLGLHRLKDLGEPAHLFQIAAPESSERFGRLRSLPSLTNLPIDRSSFLGRAEDVTALAERASAHRLVTLVGPGGVGKTRLATHAVAQIADRFGDGAWFVPLAAVTDPSVIAEEIGRIMGTLAEDGTSALESLAGYVRNRQLVLLIDNCEHLLEAVAELIEHLLTASEYLTVVATSREALGLGEEALYAVDPLSVEPDGPAVQLFAERAREAGADVDLPNEAVHRICSRLDGLPLAIELAAAKTRVLRLEDLERRLDDRFSLLRGSRTGDPHHRTLAATIAWSYELASAEEQETLNRLSVFNGLFSLDGASAVAGFEPLDDLAVIESLERLVERSLISVATTNAPERYYLLESIKEYAGQRLEDGPSDERAHRRLVDLVADLAATPTLPGSPEEAAWLSSMHRNATSLRAALHSAERLASDRLAEMVVGATPYWTASGFADEGTRWAVAARRRHASAPLIESHADLLLAAGTTEAADAALDEAWESTGVDEVARARILRKRSSRSSMVMNNLRTADGGENLVAAAELLGDPHADWPDDRIREWISIQLDLAGAGYFEFDPDKQRVPIELVRPWLDRADHRQRVDFQMAENGLMYQVTRYRPSHGSVPSEMEAREYSPANLNEHGSALFRTGFYELLVHDVEAAHGHLAAAAEIAEQLGDSLRLARAYTYLTIATRRLGRVDECRRHAGRALDHARTASPDRPSSYIDAAVANAAWSDHSTGDGDAIERLTEAARSLRDHSSHYPFRWVALLPLLSSQVERRDHEAARSTVRELLDERLQRFPDDVEEALIAAASAADVDVASHAAAALHLAAAWRIH